jgi:hypothetical protein
MDPDPHESDANPPSSEMMGPDPHQSDATLLGRKLWLTDLLIKPEKVLHPDLLRLLGPNLRGHVLKRLQSRGISFFYFFQCCGSGSGNRCLFEPWIPDPDPG